MELSVVELLSRAGTDLKIFWAINRNSLFINQLINFKLSITPTVT